MNYKLLSKSIALASLIAGAAGVSAAQPATFESTSLGTWRQVNANAIEKENADGSLERIETSKNVTPDALNSTSGTLCVNAAGPAHNGYAYQFDSDIETGLLGTRATARAHVADIVGGSSPAPTTSVTSTAASSNGVTVHSQSSSGGFGDIVTATSDFDFFPVPAACSDTTTSQISLSGGGCASPATVTYSKSLSPCI